MYPDRRKLFWILDLLCLLLAFIVAGKLAFYLHIQFGRGGMFYGDWLRSLSPVDGSPFPRFRDHLWIFFLVAPATVMSIDILGGHVPIRNQKIYKTFVYGILAPLTGVALLSTLFFILKTPGYSRLIVLSFAAVACAVICASRLIAHAWYRFTLHQGAYLEDVAIVGTREAANLVTRMFREKASRLEYRVSGYFSVAGDSSAGDPAGDAYGLRHLGSVGNLEELLVHEPIQRLIIVLPHTGNSWLEGAVKTADYFRITTHIIPESILTVRLDDLVPAGELTPGAFPALTLSPPESQSGWLVLKRVLDVCVSATMLVLLLPLFLAVAIAIKLTTPELPVFFAWKVVGYRGRRFTGYKFTTMIADAHTKIDQLANLNEMSGPVFKIAKDPRVTPLGRFLRKYSINELPQLWSVLKGDMSLVGPRPAWPHELARYELWHKRKLSAQPGLTCLWQVSGRNRISNFDEWVRLDLEYIETRSMWLDCKILARTVWVVARGTGS